VLNSLSERSENLLAPKVALGLSWFNLADLIMLSLKILNLCSFSVGLGYDLLCLSLKSANCFL